MTLSIFLSLLQDFSKHSQLQLITKQIRLEKPIIINGLEKQTAYLFIKKFCVWLSSLIKATAEYKSVDIKSETVIGTK